MRPGSCDSCLCRAGAHGSCGHACLQQSSAQADCAYGCSDNNHVNSKVFKGAAMIREPAKGPEGCVVGGKLRLPANVMMASPGRPADAHSPRLTQPTQKRQSNFPTLGQHQGAAERHACFSASLERPGNGKGRPLAIDSNFTRQPGLRGWSASNSGFTTM
jgi:hypothetical protein